METYARAGTWSVVDSLSCEEDASIIHVRGDLVGRWQSSREANK